MVMSAAKLTTAKITTMIIITLHFKKKKPLNITGHHSSLCKGRGIKKSGCIHYVVEACAFGTPHRHTHKSM